jgi:hypothetical protein
MGQTMADLAKKSKSSSNKPTSKSTDSATTAGFEIPAKNVSGITASNQRRYAEYVAGLFNTSAEVVQPREQNPKMGVSTRHQ